MPKPLIALLAVLAGTLVAPTAASAATFQVDDDAGPVVQCTPAVTCPDIADAVAAARLNDEPDTIVLAPGTYGRIALIDPKDGNLTIQGAGESSDPATGSTLTYGGPQGQTIQTTPDAAGLTLRSLRVVNTGDPGDAPTYRGFVLGLNGADSTLEDVTVESAGLVSGDDAIDARAADITLRRVTVTAPGSMGVYSQDAPSLLIADSSISVGGSAAAIDVRGGNPGMRVERTRLKAGPTAGRLVSIDADRVVFDSVVMSGGASGAVIFSPATLRHVTIDTATPGVADPLTDVGGELSGHGLLVSTAPVTLDSSVVLEPVTGTGLTCEFSNVADAEGTGNGLPAACPNGGGNASGNANLPPSALFVDGPGGDYRLKAGSPARDRGAPVPIPAGGSKTDLAGQPRTADGDRTANRAATRAPSRRPTERTPRRR